MPPVRAPRDTPTLVALTCGGVLVVGCLTVLLGWVIGSERLVRLHPDLPSMRANAALSLAVIGLALVMAAMNRHATSAVLAGLAMVAPVLDVIDWIVGRDIGLDLFLLRDEQARIDPDIVEPGRLSPGATGTLLGLSVALILVNRRPRLAQAAAVGAGLAGLFGLAADVYDPGAVPQVQGAPGVALHGAVLAIVGAVGVLALMPDLGLAAQLREPGRIGTLIRQFTVVAFVLPLLVGAIGMIGFRTGRYEAAFAVALVTTAWTAGLLAILWWGALNAVPVERQGDLSRHDARESRERLALLAEVSQDFAATPDLGETLEGVTRRIATELRGACAIRLVDPTGQKLVHVTAHHPRPERQAELERLLDRDTQLDQGLSGQLLRSGLPGLLERSAEVAAAVIDDPELSSALAEYGRRPSAVVAGLRVGGRPIGVVSVLRDQDSEPLDEDDLDLVIALADRAAQAIHNGQLVEARARRDAALAQLARRALSAHDPSALRAGIVEVVADALESRHAILLEPDREGVLRVSASTGTPEDPGLPLRMPITATVPVEVQRSGEPYVCADMRTETSAQMVALAEALGTESGLAVAVPGRTAALGVLTVVAVGTSRYTPDDVDFARAFAGLSSAALQRLDAERSLEVVAEERRALLDRLVSAQEDERGRIADGVHQDQVQVIAAADLRLGVLARRAGELDPALAEDVAFARDAVSGAADRLRALLFELEPPDPAAGLDDALAEAAAYLLDPMGAEWTVASTSAVTLTQGHRTTAYRIAKEALANAARHAGAANVAVRITDQDGGMLVRVVDDGVGMARVPERSAPGHLGMSSMRDWVEVAGGRLEVTSAPGQGTTVEFWLPDDVETLH